MGNIGRGFAFQHHIVGGKYPELIVNFEVNLASKVIFPFSEAVSFTTII
jgi:hypothetical protein